MSDSKTSRLEVVIDDTIDRLWCKHGPALLFRRISEDDNCKSTTEEFFACSACRNPNECQLVHKNKFKEVDTLVEGLVPFELLNQTYEGFRFYCKRCDEVFLAVMKGADKHVGHQVSKIPESVIPSRFLDPINDDTTQAQYFFSQPTLDFFYGLLTRLGITHVLCVGAPALHDHLVGYINISSFLLDIDTRLYSLYPSEEFALYNMFNHHFFTTDEHFLKFIQNENLLIFTDPPFGCRTEVLTDTLRKLTAEHKKYVPNRVVPIIWVFPYFMENYIQKVMPELSMCDYKINYSTHATYNETSKARKDLGSPIRFFTNVFPRLLKLPDSEGYKFCEPCDRYVSQNNPHCKLCGVCPSKNGAQYKHCSKCHICVKPNYEHCNNCKKCAQKNHDCGSYKKHIRCYICYNKGHAEVECQLLAKKRLKGARGNCLICGQNGHTHLNCQGRGHFVISNVK